MRKNFVLFLSLCLLLLLPLQAGAATPLDPAQPCALTLRYTQEGVGFSGLQVELYRVAEAFADGTFELISPYDSYSVNIHGITSQQEWKDAASTLAAYIAADSVVPDYVATTDREGTAHFTGLETGLYLVGGIQAEHESGRYTFDRFLIFLPTPLEDGSFDYDLEAKPKCSGMVPNQEYRVLKLWKDSGAEGSRPDSITVEIRRDGMLVETVVLNSENNWSHSWQVAADDTGVWTVSEKDVPEGYTVTVSEKEAAFTITNTRELGPEEPPQTGDTFAIWPWVLALCLSGSGLLLLGTYRVRRYGL